MTRAALFFALLTAAATFPLVNFVDPVLPDADDAQFGVWRLSWVAHQIASDPAHLFDANIFHPMRSTLAYSDAMLAVSVTAAPLVWLGFHPVVVHNLMLLAAIALSGVAAFALCRELTGDAVAALVGGMVFAFAPYRVAHLGHLELQWTAFMPVALLLLTRRRAVASGVAIALQGLCSLYYVAYFGIYLIAWGFWRLVAARSDERRRLALTLGVAAIVAATLLGPYFIVYARAREAVGPRPLTQIEQFSATPADYLRVSGDNRLYTPGPREAQDERSLFPGYAAALLAIIGVALGRTRERWCYAALGVLAVALSFGTHAWLYARLLDAVPWLWGFRAPARFGILVLLSLAVLSSIGLAAIISRLPARAAHVVAAIALALCAIEYWSSPASTRVVPLTPSNVYRWLAGQRAVILELPVPQPDALWGMESWHEYMSIYHWSRLVNGYSGFAPVPYVVTLETLRDGSGEQIAERLRLLGVNYLVLHESMFGPEAFAAAFQRYAALPGAGAPQTFNDPRDPAIVIPFPAERSGVQ